MKYKIWSALILVLITIVSYVNFNIKGSDISDLFGYMKDYITVGLLIYIISKLYNDITTRCLLYGLAFYYSFELIMDIIEVFNDDLHHLLYKKKYINYSVALGMVVALILPLFKIRKK